MPATTCRAPRASTCSPGGSRGCAAAAPLPGVGVGPTRHLEAIEAALLATDDSYLAVQGPPGTGKTYVASRVIARLVLERGWAVGVTSQGHKAIENVLRAVVAAGVPPEQVGKATRDPEGATWTTLAKADELAEFAAGHVRAGRGYVVGGTAWDLTSTKRIGRGQLDLVVVDEAGQFSLAKTLACSVAGDRLLLLGDPQQLPQVSQGTHPDPVDASALGWLIGDEPVLSGRARLLPRDHLAHAPGADRARSRGCRTPASCAPRPSVTAARRLEGVEPGLHVRLVDHHDNSTWSPEEAEVVRDLVHDLLGRTWHDPAGARRRRRTGRSATAAPRRRHRHHALQRPGRPAAPHPRRRRPRPTSRSAPSTSSRGRRRRWRSCRWRRPRTPTSRAGMGFLLDRHRLNVAISRGQHCAYIVRSTVLTDFAPRTPAELIDLGAFLGLCAAAATTASAGQSEPVPA